MEKQKVEQVLREIFDRYGTAIVQESGKFRSAVSDLLNGWENREELRVFRAAIETGVLKELSGAGSINAKAAGKAKERLKAIGHMTEEEAEFVVECFVSVCGLYLNENTGNDQETADEENRSDTGRAAGAIPQKKERRRFETPVPEQEELLPYHVGVDWCQPCIVMDGSLF